MESEVKIRKSLLEKYINNFSDRIQHMGDSTLPEVMLELQAEELALLGIKFSKEAAEKVFEFSIENIEFVFHCWMMIGDGEDWLENMIAEEKAERINGHWRLRVFYPLFLL